MELDSVVSIKHGEVSVYQENLHTPKPPVGSKLNKPSVVVLENIFSPAGVEVGKFGLQLSRALTGAGAKMLTYEQGRWSFSVQHFSVYGLSNVDTNELQRREAYAAVSLQANACLLFQHAARAELLQ